jgi:hypothetical protein
VPLHAEFHHAYTPADCSERLHRAHDGQLFGRICYTRERSPGIWVRTCVVTLPVAPFGDAKTLDGAKERFRAAWLTFKAKHTP